jgi:hypothetical protein
VPVGVAVAVPGYYELIAVTRGHRFPGASGHEHLTVAVGGRQQFTAVAGRTACVTSDPSGNCGPYHYDGATNSNGFNTYVGNNCWADPPC